MTATVEQPHFVWVWGFAHRPEAQKWSELDYGVGDWRKEIIIAIHPITNLEFRDCSLDELIARFPLPKITDDN